MFVLLFLVDANTVLLGLLLACAFRWLYCGCCCLGGWCCLGYFGGSYGFTLLNVGVVRGLFGRLIGLPLLEWLAASLVCCDSVACCLPDYCV